MLDKIRESKSGVKSLHEEHPKCIIERLDPAPLGIHYVFINLNAPINIHILQYNTMRCLFGNIKNKIYTEITMKASFKDCPIHERNKFKDSHGMLLISVGKGYHEAGKFIATINLVNNQFKTCTIMVCDVLQRHNFIAKENDSDEINYQLALKQGDEWLDRNYEIYSKLSIPYKIDRWESWLNHPDYIKNREFIDKMYEMNSDFKSAIQHSAEEYIARVVNREDVNVDELYLRCIQYLKEECAVMLLWASVDYHYAIYPTRLIEALRVTYEKLIRPYNPRLLIPVALRFKRH